MRSCRSRGSLSSCSWDSRLETPVAGAVPPLLHVQPQEVHVASFLSGAAYLAAVRWARSRMRWRLMVRRVGGLRGWLAPAAVGEDCVDGAPSHMGSPLAADGAGGVDGTSGWTDRRRSRFHHTKSARAMATRMTIAPPAPRPTTRSVRPQPSSVSSSALMSAGGGGGEGGGVGAPHCPAQSEPTRWPPANAPEGTELHCTCGPRRHPKSDGKNCHIAHVASAQHAASHSSALLALVSVTSPPHWPLRGTNWQIVSGGEAGGGGWRGLMSGGNSSGRHSHQSAQGGSEGGENGGLGMDGGGAGGAGGEGGAGGDGPGDGGGGTGGDCGGGWGGVGGGGNGDGDAGSGGGDAGEGGGTVGGELGGGGDGAEGGGGDGGGVFTKQQQSRVAVGS